MLITPKLITREERKAFWAQGVNSHYDSADCLARCFVVSLESAEGPESQKSLVSVFDVSEYHYYNLTDKYDYNPNELVACWEFPYGEHHPAAIAFFTGLVGNCLSGIDPTQYPVIPTEEEAK